MSHFRLDHRKLLALTALAILVASVYAPLMRFAVLAGEAWAAPDCAYRRKLTFGNSASLENLTDFPVLVVLNPSRIDYSKTSATDIRFYDGATLLSKETELWNPSGSSYIWVRVPQIDNTNADYIYAYYNSSTGSTNLDDATSVWSGYAMVQHLEETSGNLTDSTSNQNDGVPYGVTLNSLGKIDGGDYYNGNAYSVIKDNATLNFGTNSFSYSFWFNTTKTSATQDILDKKGGTAAATSAGYKMVISSSGTTGFSAAIGDGTNYKRLDSGTDSAWNGNVWTMFSVVVNRTSQFMLMYINGAHKANTSISTVGSVNNTLNLRLGNDTTGLARGYFGGLDEVRISSGARSASWTYADCLSTGDQFITYGNEETPAGTVSLTLVVASPQNTTYYDTTVTLSGSTNLYANITYKLDSQADVSVSNNTQTFSTSLAGVSYGSHSVTVNAVETGNPTNTNSSTVCFAVQPVPWADPACHYRIRLTFNNSASSENLTDFAVLVVLNPERIDYSKTSATDIRFYDWGTLLKKETELWNASGSSYIWVKVPQVDNTATDFIYAYYNCSGSSNLDDAASVWSDYAMVQHLEETSGTVLTDSTSNNNDGQPVGVTLDTPGKIDGADDYVGSVECYSNVTDSSSLNFGTNSFSYSFWFKSRWNGTQDVIDKKNGNADAVLAGYKMTISSVDATGYSVALGDGVSNVRLNTGPEPTRGANVWTMFTVVVNRTEQLMYAYVNDVLRKSVSISSIGSVSNNLNLTLGRGYDSGVWGRNYTGSLDEVCIMNGARSTSGVKAQYLSMNDSFIIFDAEEFHNDAPNKPSGPSPSNGATGIPTPTTLSVTVTDPQGDLMNVSFYQVAPSPPENFTIVVLPDTQNYALSYPGIFDNQTRWAANSAAALHIVFVTHEGDLIDGYDSVSQWNNANHSMSILDGVIPWAIGPGNHDLNRSAPTNTTNFNIYFNATRFAGYSWYGGSYNNDNANSYQLFTCGSDRYLTFHLQYNPSDAVLTWANQTIDSYSDRRVIVTTHEYLTSGSRTSIGENIWQKFIRPHADRIFLVLSGHSSRESRRTDAVNSHTVYQVEADYQGDLNGGNGWLRLLEFKPLEDKIYVKTYSPLLNNFETDSDSQFTLDYDMSGTTPTPALIGTALNVPSGNIATVPWNGLNYSTTYQWYAVANDTYGATNQSDTWSFTTTTQPTYALTVFTVGSGSVNLNNTGPYYYGDVVELTAEAGSIGWRFDYWSGDLSGSANPETILIDGNKTVNATFVRIEYTLTVNIVGSGTVNRNNSGPYYYGDAVELTAVPSPGWSFEQWGGDLRWDDPNPATIVIDIDSVVNATFTQNTYTLTTSVIGSGSINRNNSGPYVYGDVVEVTAVPSPGWSFDHWSGNLTGSTNPETIIIDENEEITATFTQNVYNLTVSVVGDGIVNLNNSGPYYYGDIVQLAAVPSHDWSFHHWSGDLTGPMNPTMILIDGNKAVTAVFTEYTITVGIVGSGVVNLNNSGPYYLGDVVELTAIPSTEWSFDHWSGDLTGSSNPTTILINGDKSVTATFTQNTYTLTISIIGSGSINRNDSGPYHLGDSVELYPMPSTGWSFDHWSGDLTGSDNPATIFVDGDKSVNATFTQNVYTLTISIVGSGSVDRNNSGPYHYGDFVELTAVPSPGWSFIEWSGDAKGNSNPTTIFMSNNMGVWATFNQNVYSLTVNTVGNGSVNLNNTGPYYYGDVVELAAVPSTDWSFNHWSGDLTGFSNPDTIVMTGHRSVTAHFTEVVVGNHDIAVTSVVSYRRFVGRGAINNITVTLQNQGNFTETFNVTIRANSTNIGMKEVALQSGNTISIVFEWNSTGFAYGNYTLSVYAWPVQNETDVEDNTFVGGRLAVAIPGDVNGDGTVNILDSIIVGNSFLTTPSSSNWNPDADINNDGAVNILDSIIIGLHFLEHQ